MPTTTATQPTRDMTPAWAGRDRANARKRLDKAIAEIHAQGWAQVILIGQDGRTTTYTHP